MRAFVRACKSKCLKIKVKYMQNTVRLEMFMVLCTTRWHYKKCNDDSSVIFIIS